MKNGRNRDQPRERIPLRTTGKRRQPHFLWILHLMEETVKLKKINGNKATDYTCLRCLGAKSIWICSQCTWFSLCVTSKVSHMKAQQRDKHKNWFVRWKKDQCEHYWYSTGNQIYALVMRQHFSCLKRIPSPKKKLK